MKAESVFFFTTNYGSCYDDETTLPGEDGRPAVPSDGRTSQGHPDALRSRTRFPSTKGTVATYRSRESLSAARSFHGRPDSQGVA